MSSNAIERLQEKDMDDHSKGSANSCESNASTTLNIQAKQKPSDSPKKSQSTVSIIKSVFKIHQGNNAGGDDSGPGKKQKVNGQIKGNAKAFLNEPEDSQCKYEL